MRFYVTSQLRGLPVLGIRVDRLGNGNLLIVALPSRIADLVQHFTQHIDSFKSGNYNETRARIQFIDPFFKELGWDMENTRGAAEAYKDVIDEDAVKVAGSLESSRLFVSYRRTAQVFS